MFSIVNKNEKKMYGLFWVFVLGDHSSSLYVDYNKRL